MFSDRGTLNASRSGRLIPIQVRVAKLGSLTYVERVISGSILQLGNLGVAMKSQPKNGSRDARGFSLIELMIVLVISLVAAAFALPNITSAISNMRLRSSVSGIAGILQETRILSVKSNKFNVARNTTYTGANMFYTDLDFNNAFTPANTTTQVAGEPTVQAAQGVTFATAPPTAFPNAALLGPNFNPTAATIFNVGFNARGLPCTPTGGNPTTGTPASCITDGTVGYLMYFKISGSFGDSWSAITITPAGRVRTWTLNGTHWN